MLLSTLLTILGIVMAGLAGGVFVSRFRLDKENARLVKELLAIAKRKTDRVFRKEDLEGLPHPVRRYLSNVLTEGQIYVRTVQLEQTGKFRVGGSSAPWKGFTAQQHFTVDPPGFIWDARIEMAPFLPVRVVDMYCAGAGALRAKLLSMFPVVNEKPGAELNSGELLRYLAETVWFPTALLPGEGVDWEPMDETSAVASLDHGGTRVSLIFYFNSRDEVDRVVAEGRYRKVGDTFEPTQWTGRFSNYEIRNGMLIPICGEVSWNLPEADLSYWRGRLMKIEHHPGP